MKQYFCNPVNFTYRYQFNQKENGFSLNREAADPSMVLFKGKYYLFPSMTKGFLVSDDLVNWKQHPLEGVPVYDYAPDVRVIGDFLYFCASRRGKACDFTGRRTRKAESSNEFPARLTSGIPTCSWTTTAGCIFTGAATT